jgi:hypothetical protein
MHKKQCGALGPVAQRAAEWKALSAEERLPFEELAKADKHTFDLAKQAKAGKPKAQVSPYLYFCRHNRARVADALGLDEKVAHRDVTKAVAAVWKALAAEEREVYKAMTRRDCERYRSEKIDAACATTAIPEE